MCNAPNCNHDLDDDLDGLFGDATPLVPVKLDLTPKGDILDAPIRAVHEGRYEEPCTKCRGTGVWHGGFAHGQCFTCKGKGKLIFKTSSESRTKAREAAEARRARAALETGIKASQWLAANPNEADWIESSANRGFEFAVAMRDALLKYGYLTEKQEAAVRSATAKSLARQAQWATEKAERESNKAEVNVDRLAAAFATATANKLKWPKIRLAGFVFSPAGAMSTNAGAIYVKSDEGTYLGKVMGGRFSRSRDCAPALEPLIAAAAADPEQAAAAYGLQTGVCSCCGRTLTNKESVGLGIGPICREKWGW